MLASWGLDFIGEIRLHTHSWLCHVPNADGLLALASGVKEPPRGSAPDVRGEAGKGTDHLAASYRLGVVTKPATCSRHPPPSATPEAPFSRRTGHGRPPTRCGNSDVQLGDAEAETWTRAALPRADSSCETCCWDRPGASNHRGVMRDARLGVFPRRQVPSREVGKGFSPVRHATHFQGPHPRSLRLPEASARLRARYHVCVFTPCQPRK